MIWCWTVTLGQNCARFRESRICEIPRSYSECSQYMDDSSHSIYINTMFQHCVLFTSLYVLVWYYGILSRSNIIKPKVYVLPHSLLERDVFHYVEYTWAIRSPTDYISRIARLIKTNGWLARVMYIIQKSRSIIDDQSIWMLDIGIYVRQGCLLFFC